MAKKIYVADDEPTLVKKPYQKLVFKNAWEESEFYRCAFDPVYFINNYVHVAHPTKGKVRFTLFDYQVDMIRAYQNNRNVIAMCSRQLGKTATAAAFILWFTTFQEDKNVLIAANVFRAATEIMDRFKFAYEYLPDFIRAGVVKYNVTTILFDNGCKVESATTTPTTGRGKSISLLYCLAGETTVDVRNKHTGLVERITMSDLQKRLKNK
jgi:hypothetical protein